MLDENGKNEKYLINEIVFYINSTSNFKLEINDLPTKNK
jgi:hypothetical protein